MASKAITRDYNEIQRKRSTLFSAGPVGDDKFHWEATLMGPLNTPYEGGAFKITIHYPPDYPFSPPKICFKTKMFHHNISDQGNIFHKILKRDHYNPSYTLYHVLTKMYEMLAEPMISDDDHFVEEIAKLYREDKEAYESKAKACSKEKEE